MRGVRNNTSADSAKRRAALKERAAAARAHAAAAKTWATQIATATAGTIWRVSSSWIDEATKIRCAELTHVGTGKIRTIRLPEPVDPDACRAQVLTE